MKTKLLLSTLTVMLALSGAAAAQSQNMPLGDYARAIKKEKAEAATTKTTKPQVFDNDNLPANATLNVVGKPTQDDSSPDQKDQDQSANTDSTDKANSDKTANNPDKKNEPGLKPGQSTEDRDKALDAWKAKIAAQKDKVDLAARELDVLQREYQLKVSEFYNDAARRAENPNALMTDDDKYKQQIADKQKALDDAKAALSEMQDQAHRQGAPDSVTE